jgi:mono/diheme cytochrome c family protein
MRLLFAALFLLSASTAAAAQTPDFPGDAAAGWVYAQQHCGGCHTQNGPRTFRAIANQNGMTGMALVAWLTATEHRTMPHLVLKADEARNVVAYILSLQDPPAK